MRESINIKMLKINNNNLLNPINEIFIQKKNSLFFEKILALTLEFK